MTKKISYKILGIYLIVQMSLIFLKLIGIGLSWNFVLNVTAIPASLVGIIIGVMLLKKYGNTNPK